MIEATLRVSAVTDMIVMIQLLRGAESGSL